MATTKELVLAEAVKLGITLTETQITDFITKDKLPDEAFKFDLKYIELEEKAKTDPQALKELIQLLKDANSEAKDRRLKNKELQGKLDKFDTDKKKELEEKMKEEGKLKELLETKEKEVEELKGYKTKFEETDTLIRTNELAKLKPEMVEIAKELSTAKLIEFTKLNSVPDPNNPHNGNPTPPGSAVVLTEDQKAEAKALGLSDSGYLYATSGRVKEKV